MSKYSSRQLYFFLACISPLGKIILMPSQLVYYAKNDLLLCAAINYALQTAAVFLVLLLSRRNQTFYELLKRAFGKTAAAILLTIFSLFLFYAALLPLIEQKLFVQSVFYDTLPSTLAFAPFFLLSAYLCAKPLGSLGRVWDILAPLSVIGYAGIIALSAGQADFGSVLPVGASGAKGIFGGAAFSSTWFFDAALLLTLIGKFDYKKGLAWKGTLCYALGAAAVLFFLAVFYGIFSDIALRQLFAFTKISKYFSGITVLGRIDYAFIFTLALTMAFYCIFPLQAGAECLREAYGGGKTFAAIAAVVINAAMLALTSALDFSFQTLLAFITRTAFWIFPVFCLLIPAAALLLLLRRNREKSD